MLDFKIDHIEQGQTAKSYTKELGVVIERGDPVTLSSGLLIRAVAGSTSIGIAAETATDKTSCAAYTEGVVLRGDADDVFADSLKGAEVDLVIAPGRLETGIVSASVAELAAITDASFRVGIDGTAYNVDAIDLSSGSPTTYAAIAALIQTALRTATSGSETVTYDADLRAFIISSVTATRLGTVSILTTSTGTVGTDISGPSYLNGSDGAGRVIAPQAKIDVGSSSTDVFKIDPSEQSGVVGSAARIRVAINKPLS